MSELCLDTASFGWRIDEEMSLALLDEFREAGGSFIRTCSVASDGAAVAERYVGHWVRSRGISRSDVVIASRVDITADGASGDVFRTASTIRRRCEGTLRELGMRYLDLLVVQWAEDLAMDEVLLAAETLVRAGLVRHFAVSGFPTWRVMEWLGHSARRNLCRIEAMESELSLMSNAGLNLESMSLARAHRVGLVARAPLAGGMLADRGGTDRGTADHALQAMTELRRIATAHGADPGQVAVSWVLAHADISSVLIGPHTVSRLRDHVAATSLGLSFSELRRLDWHWKSTVRPPFDGDEEPDDKPDHLRLEDFEAEPSENLNV